MKHHFTTALFVTFAATTSQARAQDPSRPKPEVERKLPKPAVPKADKWQGGGLTKKFNDAANPRPPAPKEGGKGSKGKGDGNPGAPPALKPGGPKPPGR